MEDLQKKMAELNKGPKAPPDIWIPEGTGPEMVARIIAETTKRIPEANQFNVGDVITPLADKGVRGRGKAWLVLEQSKPKYITHDLGSRAEICDITLALMLGEEYIIFQNYSGYFELFDESKAKGRTA